MLRPYLTSYVNLCWVIGQFIGAGVLRGFLNHDDQWAYRVPFAIQWVSRHSTDVPPHDKFKKLTLFSDLAADHPSWRRSGPRESLVARPPWEIRRSPESPVEPHQGVERHPL